MNKSTVMNEFCTICVKKHFLPAICLFSTGWKQTSIMSSSMFRRNARRIIPSMAFFPKALIWYLFPLIAYSLMWVLLRTASKNVLFVFFQLIFFAHHLAWTDPAVCTEEDQDWAAYGWRDFRVQYILLHLRPRRCLDIRAPYKIFPANLLHFSWQFTQAKGVLPYHQVLPGIHNRTAGRGEHSSSVPSAPQLIKWNCCAAAV